MKFLALFRRKPRPERGGGGQDPLEMLNSPFLQPLHLAGEAWEEGGSEDSEGAASWSSASLSGTPPPAPPRPVTLTRRVSRVDSLKQFLLGGRGEGRVRHALPRPRPASPALPPHSGPGRHCLEVHDPWHEVNAARLEQRNQKQQLGEEEDNIREEFRLDCSFGTGLGV